MYRSLEMELWEIFEIVRLNAISEIQVVGDDEVIVKFKNGRTRWLDRAVAAQLKAQIDKGAHLGVGGQNGPSIRQFTNA